MQISGQTLVETNLCFSEENCLEEGEAKWFLPGLLGFHANIPVVQVSMGGNAS